MAAASNAGLLCIPGCMTSTEVMQAEALGAKLIKNFFRVVY